jgi:hypothetical protein
MDGLVFLIIFPTVLVFKKTGRKFEIHTELGMPPPRDGYKMPPVVKGRTP